MMSEHSGAVKTADESAVDVVFHSNHETLRVATGIAGFDAILGGGLPRDQACLVQGDPGAGKTTFALQFAIAGAQQNERVLYLSTCESEAEIRNIAKSHGWDLEGVDIHYHDARKCFGDDGKDSQQSVFHPAEVELPRTIEALLSAIDRADPQRLVIDSLSEIRLLAADPRWFRQQVLTLKEDLGNRECTTLFCDDRLSPDQPVQSIVHGVIELEQLVSEYGPDHRRLRVVKMRAQPFSSGYHDMTIRTGGINVYPRLIAAEHRGGFSSETISSGLAELDTMFGGGIDRGTATLLLGPSGTGKSTMASQIVAAAAGRNERGAMFIFDERIQTLLDRAKGLGLDLEEQLGNGLVEVHQVDPAELTAGEFSQTVSRAVTERDVRLVVIDSLAGYLNAMPNERLLTLYLHELLSYLNHQGVTVLMVMTQHGLPGISRHTPFDLSYIADSVLLFQTFEYAGELHKAISVYKRRYGAHEPTLRELCFGAQGIQIGEPLRQFQGIVTGTPSYTGERLPDVRDHDQS
ncbi:MAG: AAA family ATPase [Pirellulales bacterium]|nr:AAA family ATPase [Pirellulales bacterium]